jgi:hypothetical protein
METTAEPLVQQLMLVASLAAAYQETPDSARDAPEKVGG